MGTRLLKETELDTKKILRRVEMKQNYRKRLFLGGHENWKCMESQEEMVFKPPPQKKWALESDDLNILSNWKIIFSFSDYIEFLDFGGKSVLPKLHNNAAAWEFHGVLKRQEDNQEPKRDSCGLVGWWAVSTLLGLVTVMNQHIIETAPPLSTGSGVGSRPRADPGPEHDDPIPWSLCISVMKEVEVLMEMIADYYLGKDKKWGPVASVEAIK